MPVFPRSISRKPTPLEWLLISHPRHNLHTRSAVDITRALAHANQTRLIRDYHYQTAAPLRPLCSGEKETRVFQNARNIDVTERCGRECWPGQAGRRTAERASAQAAPAPVICGMVDATTAIVGRIKHDVHGIG